MIEGKRLKSFEKYELVVARFCLAVYTHDRKKPTNYAAIPYHVKFSVLALHEGTQNNVLFVGLKLAVINF